VALYVVVHQHRGFQKKTLNYPFRTQFYLVLRRRRVWLLAFYTGLSFAHFMVLTNLWSATFLRQRYHISDELAVMVNALCMMGFILGCPLFGFLSRYVSPRKLLAGGALAQCMLLMAVFYQALPLPVDGALLLLQGVATGSVVLVFKLVRHYVPKRVLGMASGLVNLFFGGIAMLITPLVGLIYQHTNDVHLALFPVMLASGTALLCLLTLYVLDQRQLSLKLP
jgi:sugar phosphate permease